MKKLFIIIIAALLCCLIGCRYYTPSAKEVAETIEEYTNVLIPEEAKLEEYYTSSVFMHGHLPEYCIFTFDTEPTEFLEEYKFKVNTDKTKQKTIYEKIKFNNENYKMMIPESSYVNWNEDYLCHWDLKRDYYFIYQTRTCKLIVMNFMP